MTICYTIFIFYFWDPNGLFISLAPICMKENLVPILHEGQVWGFSKLKRENEMELREKMHDVWKSVW